MSLSCADIFLVNDLVNSAEIINLIEKKVVLSDLDWVSEQYRCVNSRHCFF